MVVSGYTMDLYCDCEICTSERNKFTGDGGSHHYNPVGFKQIGGESFRECITYAKRVGWKFKKSNTECYAPGHKIKREAL